MVHFNEAVKGEFLKSPAIQSKHEAIFCRLTKLRVLTEIMSIPDFSQHSPHIIQTYGWIINDFVEEVETLFSDVWDESSV